MPQSFTAGDQLPGKHSHVIFPAPLDLTNSVNLDSFKTSFSPAHSCIRADIVGRSLMQVYIYEKHKLYGRQIDTIAYEIHTVFWIDLAVNDYQIQNYLFLAGSC